MLMRSQAQLSDETLYLGANIYYWGEQEIRYLLLHGLKSWASKSRSEGLSDFFWWTRFDARGPHIFTIFSAANKGKGEQLRQLLNHWIEYFLLTQSSTVELDSRLLEERHRNCRGGKMCIADTPDEIAPNNTFQMFSHHPANYPLSLVAGMQNKREFLGHLDRLAFRAIHEAQAEDVFSTAIRWIAEIDQVLPLCNVSPEDYWFFHLSTLFVFSDSKHWRERRNSFLSHLPKMLSEGNRISIAKTWLIQSQHSAGTDTYDLVRSVLAEDGRTLDDRYMVLRQINHQLLLQIGLLGKFEIPLVLYAWFRSLSSHARGITA